MGVVGARRPHLALRHKSKPDNRQCHSFLTLFPFSGTFSVLGETSKTITIVVKGDKKKESDETFFVNLSGAAGAVIANGQGIGTILNDD